MGYRLQEKIRKINVSMLYYFYMSKRLLQLLLAIGAGFFIFEFFLHFFGLPMLDHDKIFLPTHDRYIALYGLTYAALLTLCAIDIKKYRTLFVITMIGILFGMLNAKYIATHHWYTTNFNAPMLDQHLSYIGLLAVVWYIATWVLWWRSNHTPPWKGGADGLKGRWGG